MRDYTAPRRMSRLDRRVCVSQDSNGWWISRFGDFCLDNMVHAAWTMPRRISEALAKRWLVRWGYWPDT